MSNGVFFRGCRGARGRLGAARKPFGNAARPLGSPATHLAARALAQRRWRNTSGRAALRSQSFLSCGPGELVVLHVGRRAPIPSEKALTRAAAPFATVIAARYLGIFPLVQTRDRVRPLVRPHSKRGYPWFSRDASVQGATRAPICCTCHSLGLDFLEWNCAVVLFFVLAAASCFPVRLPRWVRAGTDLGRLRLTDLRPMLPANARDNQSLERNAPSNDRVLARPGWDSIRNSQWRRGAIQSSVH